MLRKERGSFAVFYAINGIIYPKRGFNDTDHTKGGFNFFCVLLEGVIEEVVIAVVYTVCTDLGS